MDSETSPSPAIIPSKENFRSKIFRLLRAIILNSNSSQEGKETNAALAKKMEEADQKFDEALKNYPQPTSQSKS